MLSREGDVGAWVPLRRPKTTCFGSYGHHKFDRLTTIPQAAILWHASCVWWREVGVGWGIEISCVLSREGDGGALVQLCQPKSTFFGSYCHIQVDRLTINL